MVRNNPRLPRWVPGGHPMNPLGVRALYLGSSAYRIHGTDAPWTIGQAVSHGCIRMTNKDVLDLYPRVNVGMRVTVTWQRFSTKPVASSSDYSSSEDNSAADNGGSAPARTNRKVSDGSLGSLFFWQDDPAPAAEQAPAKKKSSAPAAAKTSAPEKSTDATSSSTPKATKVSASSADNLPVHKASAEVQ
jgi:hypothetical protein